MRTIDCQWNRRKMRIVGVHCASRIPARSMSGRQEMERNVSHLSERKGYGVVERKRMNSAAVLAPVLPMRRRKRRRNMMRSEAW